MDENHKSNESEHGKMNLKINDVITVKCLELDYKGHGVARYNDLVIFTEGLLKDEEAVIKITKVSKSFANAKVVEIIKEASNRKSKLHKLSALDFYHLNEADQLDWQIDNTVDTFKKIANIELEYKNNVIANDNYLNYRNKNVFHVLPSKTLTLGLYNSNNNQLTRVDEFELGNEVVNKALSYINNLDFKLDHLKDNLKHIVFRTNKANELMIIVVLKEKSEIKELIKALSLVREVKSIYINISKTNKQILGNKSYLVHGTKYLTEQYGDLLLPFDDQSFLQINTDVATNVYETINDYINNDEIVIDAYSGVGGIGLFIKDKARHVYLLENNLSSTNISNAIIENNNYQNISVIHGDVLTTISDLQGDTLIVDPPRKGLNENFITTILSKDFNKIIYLSCNIKTQARDIALLNEKYEIMDFHPIKMFYQTSSIENLVILKKRV